MSDEKPNIVREWYKVEYNYIENGSSKILYKASQSIDTRKGAEEFAALIVHLSETPYTFYTDMQRKMSDKVVGEGKSVIGLAHFYKFLKIEIPIKGNRGR